MVAEEKQNRTLTKLHSGLLPENVCCTSGGFFRDQRTDRFYESITFSVAVQPIHLALASVVRAASLCKKVTVVWEQEIENSNLV